MTGRFDTPCSSCGASLLGAEIRRDEQTGRWVHQAPCARVEQPKRSAPDEALEAGIYERPDGAIYVVRPTRDHARLYANRLRVFEGERLNEEGNAVCITFDYERGAIYTLRAAMRMPAERAKVLSLQYRHCIVCGRLLSDAKSVERGIGPVCIRYCAGGKVQ